MFKIPSASTDFVLHTPGLAQCNPRGGTPLSNTRSMRALVARIVNVRGLKNIGEQTTLSDVYSPDFDYGVCRTPFVYSNELGGNALVRELQVQSKDEGERLHIGFAGFLNLDIMAARKSSHGILLDVNSRQVEFWELVSQTIISAQTPREFISMFNQKLCIGDSTNPRYYSKNHSWLVFSGETELSRSGSWLNESEPDRFLHIRKMFCDGRVIFRRVDLLDSNKIAELVIWTHLKNQAPDTIYISNIREWLVGRNTGREIPPVDNPIANNQSLERHLSVLKGSQTILIESERTFESPARAVVKTKYSYAQMDSPEELDEIRNRITLAVREYQKSSPESMTKWVDQIIRESLYGLRIDEKYGLFSDGLDNYTIWELDSTGLQKRKAGSVRLQFGSTKENQLTMKIGSELDPDHQGQGLSRKVKELVEKLVPPETECFVRMNNIRILISCAEFAMNNHKEIVQKCLKQEEFQQLEEILDYWKLNKHAYVDHPLYRVASGKDILGRDLNDGSLTYFDEGDSRAIHANWQLRQHRLLRNIAKIFDGPVNPNELLPVVNFYKIRDAHFSIVTNQFGDRKLEIRWNAGEAHNNDSGAVVSADSSQQLVFSLREEVRKRSLLTISDDRFLDRLDIIDRQLLIALLGASQEQQNRLLSTYREKIVLAETGLPNFVPSYLHKSSLYLNLESPIELKGMKISKVLLVGSHTKVDSSGDAFIDQNGELIDGMLASTARNLLLDQAKPHGNNDIIPVAWGAHSNRYHLGEPLGYFILAHVEDTL